MSDTELDATSYYSLEAADIEHTVRFTLELHYFVQKELDPRGKNVKVKSIPDIKDSSSSPPPAEKDKHGKAAAGSTSKEHSSRYYITFNIGSKWEGKSELLHPSNSFWSANQEIAVNLEFLADMYEGPIEIKLWQVKKVWGESNDPTVAAMQGKVSKQTLMFRRASLHAIARRLVALSKSERLSPKTRRRIETFRNYVLHNYSQLPPAVKIRAQTFPPPRPLPGTEPGAPPPKIPAAPHRTGSSNPRRELMNSRASSATSTRASRAIADGATKEGMVGDLFREYTLATQQLQIQQFAPSAAGAATAGAMSAATGGGGGGGAASVAGGADTSTSDPHHPGSDHAFSLDMDRGALAGGDLPPRQPGQDLSGIVTFVRAKTSPQPHHFDEPDRTAPLVAELPRKTRVLVDQQAHVGSIFIDPGSLFLGEIHVRGSLLKPVEGLQEVEAAISLNGPLLSTRQEESLNPMVITVQTIDNLPDRPIAYDALRKACLPVYTRFQFPDHAVGRHRSQTTAPQQKSVRLDSRHVILTGLHDEDVLRDFFIHQRLEIEVHDRDRRVPPADQDKMAAVQSFGIARFSLLTQIATSRGTQYIDLSELVAGESLLILKSPVVPADMRDSSLMKNAISSGFYLECDTIMKIKVDAKYPIFSFGEMTTLITRAVVVANHSQFRYLEQLLDEIERYNCSVLQLGSIAELIELKMSPEQRRNTKLDLITGYLLSDGKRLVLFFEGQAGGGMKRMQDAINELSKSAVITWRLFMDMSLSFSSRIWIELTPNIQWIHLNKTLDELMCDSKTFLRRHTPKRAYQAIRMCHDIVTGPFTNVFELSSHGLLPSVEQLQELRDIQCQLYDDSHVPLEKVRKTLGIMADNMANLSISDSSSNVALSGVSRSPRRNSPSKTDGAPKGGAVHESVSVPASPRRDPIGGSPWPPHQESHSPAHDVIAKARAKYPGGAAPRARAPTGARDQVVQYSTQACNTREQAKREVLARAHHDHPRELLTYEFAPHRTVELDALVRPPWEHGDKGSDPEDERGSSDEAASPGKAKAGGRGKAKADEPVAGRRSRVSSPRLGIAGADLNDALRRSEPYQGPSPLDLFAMPLPDRHVGGGCAPAFHVKPVHAEKVLPSDYRAIVVSGDAFKELTSMERENAVRQRIEWESKKPPKGRPAPS